MIVPQAMRSPALPSEFLRVEFKNTPGDMATFRGKFERPATAAQPAALIALAPVAGLRRGMPEGGEKFT